MEGNGKHIFTKVLIQSSKSPITYLEGGKGKQTVRGEEEREG